jgi:DNA/RNA endonuclease G (NUC1)
MLALTTDTKRGVSVPTHFFKMIIVPRDEEKSSFLVSSFVIPNRAIHPKTELMNFFVPIEELEEISGLEFFPKAKEKPVGDLCKMHPSLCMLTSEDTAKKVFSKKDDAIS